MLYSPAVASSLPPWLRARLPSGENYERIKTLSAAQRLHTVCEEARCPTLGECWSGGTATFKILGESCSRGCRFCSVSTLAQAAPPDPREPERLAETIAALSLRYAVLTTVCRDDLPDQGAAHVAACVRAVRERVPKIVVEALIQDFRGERGPLAVVMEAGAEVVAHNVETVERLTPLVRDRRAGYRQSLGVLRAIKELDPSRKSKSSVMLGLGETREEVETALAELREAGVDILTLGQYLRPTRAPRHLPVERYLPPEEFEAYGDLARRSGFLYVASGPFVRSSYRAGELFVHGMLRA
ncbi:MAG: lipoyl synthase [Elusimicrobia bacterium]|nr:lipoyl synthase [Elusimicrobiota bacterium]